MFRLANSLSKSRVFRRYTTGDVWLRVLILALMIFMHKSKICTISKHSVVPFFLAISVSKIHLNLGTGVCFRVLGFKTQTRFQRKPNVEEETEGNSMSNSDEIRKNVKHILWFQGRKFYLQIIFRSSSQIYFPRMPNVWLSWDSKML